MLNYGLLFRHILIKKYKNVGKKDSIILFNDIFNHTRYNIDIENRSLREDILHNIQELFGVNKFDYIYTVIPFFSLYYCWKTGLLSSNCS